MKISRKALCVAIDELFTKHDAGLVYVPLDHKQNGPLQPLCGSRYLDPWSCFFLVLLFSSPFFPAAPGTEL